MEHVSASKRVVWQGRIEVATSAASAVQDVCCSIVARVQHSIYLRLLIEKFVKCLA